MNLHKQITLMLLVLFPIVSIATVTVDKNSINNTEKVNIIFSIADEVTGDIYIAKEFNKQFESLKDNDAGWTPVTNTQSEAFITGGKPTPPGEINRLLISASPNGISLPSGEYTFYLLIVKPNSNPFEEIELGTFLSLEYKTIRINMGNNTAPPENPEPETNITSLTSNKTVLDNFDTTTLVVNLNTPESSDQYLVVKNEGQFWFLNSNGGFGVAPTPFATGVSTVKNEEIYTLHAEAIPAGQYITYHVFVDSGSNPFTQNSNWDSLLSQLANESNRLTLHINLNTYDDVPTPGSGPFGFQTNTLLSDVYIEPTLPDKVFAQYSNVVKSKALWKELTADERENTLYWEYDPLSCNIEFISINNNTENSEFTTQYSTFSAAENQCTVIAAANKTTSTSLNNEEKTSWNWVIGFINHDRRSPLQIPEHRDLIWQLDQFILKENFDKSKITELITDQLAPNRLLWGENGEEVFDDFKNSWFVHRDTPGLTISNPLRSGIETAYPGCVGASELLHVRACGESTSKGLNGSEVHSQRWKRLRNIEVDSSETYSLRALVRLDNILPTDLLFNFPLHFEMSVSKVPGDFSENSCKPNKAIQYSPFISVNLTQAGFATSLPKECQVNADDLQYYYINVRAVEIDVINKVITEKSSCSPSFQSLTIGKDDRGNTEGKDYTIDIVCKFELFAYVDAP